MPVIAVVHIGSALLAYVLYFLLFVTAFYRVIKIETYYIVLTITNLMYWASLVMGAYWSKLAWGQYIFFDDVKIVVSFLIIVPFIILNFWQQKEKLLTGLGVAMIFGNYVLPRILESLHAHGI